MSIIAIFAIKPSGKKFHLVVGELGKIIDGDDWTTKAFTPGGGAFVVGADGGSIVNALSRRFEIIFKRGHAWGFGAR